MFRRDDFSLKLALLSNQWHGVVRRAQQRRGIIDSLLRQWQRYREMGCKLRGWLAEAARQVDEAHQGAPVPLQQVRCLLDEVQVRLSPPTGPPRAFQLRLVSLAWLTP